jgi:transposase
MSVAEQRYLAVLAVIADGHDVTAAAQQWGVSRQTLHTWMGRYEADGVEHLLTAPHSPTTTGKIERFHRSLRAECLTGQLFRSLPIAQASVDEWVEYYNTQRPHQSLEMTVPADRFAPVGAAQRPVTGGERSGDDWVSRRVGGNGVVCVSWQQVCVGKQHAGARCDVQFTEELLQFWVGNELCKTVARNSRGEVRKKRASIPRSNQ